MKKPKFYPLDQKKHGVGGLVMKPVKPRKQDRRATPGMYYMVVFFPKITQIGRAHLSYAVSDRTLSNSPEAAKMKFMDGIRQGEKWEDYARAGHRIRKVRLSDLGDIP